MSSANKEALAKALRNAIELALSATRPANFVQSVELLVAFKGVDVKKQQEFKFRDAVFLPRGLGKEVRVCMVIDEPQAQRALEAGAYKVLTKGELGRLGKKDSKKLASECDWVLVRADLMGLAGRALGPALGPRGKMPIAVPPSADVSALVRQYKSATRLYSKEQPWVGCRIGAEKMALEDLVHNALAVLAHIEEKIKRPLSEVARVYVKTTYGPPVEVQMGGAP